MIKPDVTTGNARIDGEAFGGWFIGSLRRWATEKGLPLDSASVGLRNTRDLEIKMGFHSRGEERSGGWTAPGGTTAISILLKGCFVLRFREREGEQAPTEIRLDEFADYVMWTDNLPHTWAAKEDSVILTVRWNRR